MVDPVRSRPSDVATRGDDFADDRGDGTCSGPGRLAGAPWDLTATLEARARAVIAPIYERRRHELAAVLVDSEGAYFTGINLKAATGRANVCSEGVALANAAIAGPRRLHHLLIVHKQGPDETDGYRLVPPCGVCRELLLDYAPDLSVHLTTAGGVQVVEVKHLLPFRYEELAPAHRSKA